MKTININLLSRDSKQGTVSYRKANASVLIKASFM
jgi:hypothetical protein